MAARQNVKLRLLVLAAIGAVMIATLLSFMDRWKGRVASAGDAGARPDLQPLSGEVDQQTRAFSLAKTEGDHVLYTIKADQVVTLKETQKNLLRGVVVEIFGRRGEKSGARHDRITTAECEYDPIGQTLWAPGSVEMNFELPGGAGASGGQGQNGSSGRRVVIRTSQLRFDQSTGNAATDAPVQFTFPEGEGRSRGARYDSQQQALDLVSAVEFVLKDDAAASTTIHSGELRYLRAEGRILLAKSVEMVSETRRLRSAAGTLLLDADHHVRRAELVGDVHASERSRSFSADVNAGRANVDFAEANSVRSIDMLESVSWEMAGGATAASSPPLREGRSQRMLLTFAPVAPAAGKSGGSELDRATASGNVRITLRSPEAAAGSSRAGTVGQSQVMTGQEAEMHFAQGGRIMSEARLRGAPRIEMYEAAGNSPRIITAGNFDFDFGDKGQLVSVKAAENVRVVSPVAATEASRPDNRITTSSNLLAVFDPVTGKMDSLRQVGNFTYQDSARKALSAVAEYEASKDLLTLERSLPGASAAAGRTSPQPAIVQADGRIAADWIRMNMRSGDLEASGSVATTSTPSSETAAHPAGGRQEPVHAVADKLRYDAASRTASYSGHTRIWQGTGFLLESEAAVVDRQKNSLTATGNVLTIFRPAAAQSGDLERNPKKAGTEGLAGAYVIRSDRMSYTQDANRIEYQGNVRANHEAGALRASSLDISLTRAAAAPANSLQTTASRIQKMIARGDVNLSENGRIGSGDSAEYFTESKKVNLFGKPAILSDSNRGSTKGVQLTYQIGDNRASVVGSSGEQTETRWIPTR